MSKEPLSFKATWPYLLTLVATLLIWTVLVIEITRATLVDIYQYSAIWLAISGVLLVTPIIPLWLISRSLKLCVSYNEVEWDFKEREVAFSEFEFMMKDYSKGYSMVLQKISYLKIILSGVFAVSAIFHFYVVLAIDELLIIATPYSFGFLLLIYGILLSQVFYDSTPTEAGIHFPYHSPQQFKTAITAFEQVQGIAWIGIKMVIGESGGYYTVRSPRIVARIEEIESAIEITGLVTESGQLDVIVSRFDSTQTTESEEIVSKMFGGSDDILDIVKESVRAYIRVTGSIELLEELVEELGLSDIVPHDNPSESK